MFSPVRNGFAHRANRDGTFDSICRQCFITIASSVREADLDAPEKNHMCDPAQLWQFQEQPERRPT
jgi:hypothetical protein